MLGSAAFWAFVPFKNRILLHIVLSGPRTHYIVEVGHKTLDEAEQ